MSAMAATQLGEPHETSARGPSETNSWKTTTARTAAPPSRKIGAWSAANEPLIPTPRSTIVIVSHHTTRSVPSTPWAVVIGRRIGRSEGRQRPVEGGSGRLVRGATGEHDPHQEKPRQERGDGDDGQLERHKSLVPRCADDECCRHPGRRGKYGGLGGDGANVLTHPYYSGCGQDAPHRGDFGRCYTRGPPCPTLRRPSRPVHDRIDPGWRPSCRLSFPDSARPTPATGGLPQSWACRSCSLPWPSWVS